MLNCNILDVNGGKVLCLSSSSKSFNGNFTLAVRNGGTVGLFSKNTVIISNEPTLMFQEKPSTNLKVTLVIPAFKQTTIKDTEHLIKFAQSVIDLPMDDVKNIKLEDYSLIRQVKKVNN